MMLDKTNDKAKVEILFLTRELRFSIDLIHSALEETEKFDLVINDSSFLMFMLLSSQGVERLLKLALSYDSIIKDKTEKFRPKRFRHCISKLYEHLKGNTTKSVREMYKNIFESNSNITKLMNMFTDLLETFSENGRYYFTSRDTRDEKSFLYYFDERFVSIINEYETIKIYDKNCKKKRYNEALKYAIEEAKMISDDIEEHVPRIFCRNIEKTPIVPFWEENFLEIKEPATNGFKVSSREFLLIYISPIVKMLENQFTKIMNKYKIPYYFNEIIYTIKYNEINCRKKKHRKTIRDCYSSLLL